MLPRGSWKYDYWSGIVFAMSFMGRATRSLSVLMLPDFICDCAQIFHHKKYKQI